MPARDEDHQLLGDFSRTGSQAAFARLVGRHLDLVYSVARRRVGDAHLAEDVTQAVFLTLARKAASIGSDVVISGWLFNTARLVANNALRAQQRQQKRESSARHLASAAASSSAAAAGARGGAGAGAGDWQAIAPHLESAMDHLGRGERDAVLLRFYRGMSFKEVAGAIGISEDAAAQRVSRGVAKLRAYFAARGVNTSADALTMGVATHAVAAAPAALKSTLATSATAATGTTATTTATTLSNGAVHAMGIANLKLAAVITAVIALTATVGVVSYNAISRATPAPAPRTAATTPSPAPAAAATTPTTAVATSNIDPDMAALLARKLPALRFDQIAAQDVIDFLRDVTGANLVVNERALKPLGGDAKKPLSLNVADVSFGDALRQVIRQMVDRRSAERVTFLATEGVIIITAADDVPRLRAAQEWRANMPSDAATKKVLDRSLPEVNFRDIKFSDTIDFLRDVAGANIFVNWRALEVAGVEKKTPVTLRLRNVPLRTVLWLLLESAQTRPDAPLDFAVAEGVISISTAADLANTRQAAPAARPGEVAR